MSALGFLLLPIQRRDFALLGNQWGNVARVLGRTYAGLGLIEGEAAPSTIRGVLRAAARGWVAKWGPVLKAGWRDGAGEGLLGRVGGLIEAGWAGRSQIIGDGVAVLMGWAVIGAIALGLFSVLLDLGVGAAHAAAASASSDLARKVLSDMFPFFGGATVVAQALGQIAKTLGWIAFSLAGIAAIWGCVVMLVEYTTNPDSARQRYSPWLFALRIGVAVGLLAPLAGGYSGAQRMVGFFGAWGSDKASEAWTAAAGHLGNTGKWVTRPAVAETDVLQTILMTAAAEACMEAVNSDPSRSANERVQRNEVGGGYRYDYYVKRLVGGFDMAQAGACGTVEFPAPSEASVGAAAKPVAAAHKAAFDSMRNAVSAKVKAYVAGRVACRDTPNSCTKDPDPAALATIAATYREAVVKGISSGWEQANSAVAGKLNEKANKGWIGAGEWAMSLSKLQGSISTAGSTLPIASPPTLASADDVVQGVQEWMGMGLLTGGNKLVRAQVALASGSQGAADGLLEAVGSGLWETVVEVDPANGLSSLSSVGHATWMTGVGLLAATGAVEAVLGMGKIGPNASLGEKAVEWARDKVAGLGKAALARFPVTAVVMGALGQSIGPIIKGAALASVLVGLALAYLVPALPFIRFYFAVLGWLLAFLECVVLVPVALVLMVTADHGGFFGPAAKAGLWNIVALIARPVLTVAGFVAGLMLMAAALTILNATMLPMVRDLMQGDVMLLAFVAYALIYLGVAYLAVNSSTKAAELLPQAAYRWFGANAGGERDDGSMIAGTLGGVGGRMMTEIGMRARAAGRK